MQMLIQHHGIAERCLAPRQKHKTGRSPREMLLHLSRPETNAYNELLKETKRNIEQSDPQVSGFNVGVNNGGAAGQTVEHCHVHLIPRRVGDVENPVGGIRKAISAKPL